MEAGRRPRFRMSVAATAFFRELRESGIERGK